MTRVRRRSLLLLGGSAAVLGSSAWLGAPKGAHAKKPSVSSEGHVLVELFTSQGCSSCPPADRQLRLLEERAKKTGEKILPLSFHVDYWNDLGWRDPFSSSVYSERQRAYARTSGSPGVYTPQMIVNGRSQFVGSDQRALSAALSREKARKSRTRVSVVTRSGGNELEVALTSSLGGDAASAYVALVQRRAHSKVTRGENKGRELEHVNVVRTLRRVSLGQQTLRLKLPNGRGEAEFFVAAWVQRTADLAVLAVNRTP